ncbi:hypothetical protein ALP36_04996 [Pseudomonas syringae pv. coriandricola]|uniref:Uncharacterized protein n=1 Tax=Pseudomonas syringae pv. coriandricola TaxID=264453 RepID=A0A3M5RC74_9PSED|nr:hypothetical protein ALQ72_06621 [Pseudomonas syringae pv. maculicola]RMU06034.1 hypothetical protein ALP36_04996 [Pseudomonas syringae pv. coriandricola]
MTFQAGPAWPRAGLGADNPAVALPSVIVGRGSLAKQGEGHQARGCDADNAHTKRHDSSRSRLGCLQDYHCPFACKRVSMKFFWRCVLLDDQQAAVRRRYWMALCRKVIVACRFLLVNQAFVSRLTSWFKNCFNPFRTATGGKRLSEEEDCGQVALRRHERCIRKRDCAEGSRQQPGKRFDQWLHA